MLKFFGLKKTYYMSLAILRARYLYELNIPLRERIHNKTFDFSLLTTEYHSYDFFVNDAKLQHYLSMCS